MKIMDDTSWVHFYQHDYKFERIWNQPLKYLNLLKSFSGVITTDFSLYRELPLAMQIWNTYRNRALSFWLQQNGIHIVPNVRWSDERSYGFAFEGLPQGGSFAISTNGCIHTKNEKAYFSQGLEVMVERLKPETIITYSYMPKSIFDKYRKSGIELIQIENHSQTIRKHGV